MTLARARELIAVQVSMGGGYNRNATRLILAEVSREHGQAAVDQLIEEFELAERFGLHPGAEFKSPGC